MKFRKLGQVLLASVVSTGFTVGITSCANDYTVGYVYVTGTQYNQVGAYKEDNNNGILKNVIGSPFGSGGTDPVRAIITSGGRFLFVLNAGQRTVDDSGDVSYPGSNVSVFTIGGYGQLTFQHSYDTQGIGPIRIAADSTGSHLFILDSYAPIGNSTGTIQTVSSTLSASFPCEESEGVYRATGDVTVFNIDTSTGRLDLVTNQQQQNLTYFPIGCAPVDFHLTGSYLYAMDAGSATNSDLQTVFVYGLSTSSGQLTQVQTAPQQVGGGPGSSIASITGNSGNSLIFLVDSGLNTIRPYTIGGQGALAATNGGATVNSSSVAGNPQQLVTVTGSPNTYAYVANAGPGGGLNTNDSDISGYAINTTTGHLDNPAFDSPYLGAPSGLVCIFEDPSNQFIYAAGADDSTITGRRFDPGTGSLKPLKSAVAFPTVGTPSWCLATSSNH